jgi:exodeoxyribonuclease V alpha subunit
MTALDWDPRVPHSVKGLLADFVAAGVLESADVHLARRLERIGGEPQEAVLLAVALAVRAVRLGSVCLRLSEVQESTGVEDADDETMARLLALRWPELRAWTTALEGSPLVAVGVDGPAERPLRLVDGLLYLDRYWRQERLIAQAVDDSRRRPPPALDPERLAAALHRLFPGDDADRQRLAAAVAAGRWLTVLAGGPGTGKTTTLAKLLAVLRDQPGQPVRIALAAPTGKAQARMAEAVSGVVTGFGDDDRERLGDVSATTLHRLLGWRPGGGSRFRHDRDNRLPYDVVVVDEASMVSLTLMARLIEALRDDARLILVGDPYQLASVEAGAVLGDLVRRRPPSDASATDALAVVDRDLADLSDDELELARTCGVVTLTRVHRHGGAIKALADAIKAGDSEAVLGILRRGDAVKFVEDHELSDIRSDVVSAGLDLLHASLDGRPMDALDALQRHRLLCAHREGPFGVSHWSRQIEDWLRQARADYGRGGLWYLGRPLLVTGNDAELRLFNGDTGVVVDLDGPTAVFPAGEGYRPVPTHRLSEVSTVHAMSVHKSQGSQFGTVTLVLPEPTSPLLTRELLYTAVTRAQHAVRVIGTEESVRAAVARRIQRASGLAGPGSEA